MKQKRNSPRLNAVKTTEHQAVNGQNCRDQHFLEFTMRNLCQYPCASINTYSFKGEKKKTKTCRI